jgi:hypothetical protein
VIPRPLAHGIVRCSTKRCNFTLEPYRNRLAHKVHLTAMFCSLSDSMSPWLKGRRPAFKSLPSAAEWKPTSSSEYCRIAGGQLKLLCARRKLQIGPHFVFGDSGVLYCFRAACKQRLLGGRQRLQRELGDSCSEGQRFLEHSA